MCNCLRSCLRWLCPCFCRQSKSRKKKRNVNKSSEELSSEQKRRKALNISNKRLIKEKLEDSIFDSKTYSKVDPNEITRVYTIPKDGSSEQEILESIHKIKKFDKSIGEGSYGLVFKAEKSGPAFKEPLIYAIKTIKIEPKKRKKIMQMLKNEIYALEVIRYEYVISLREHFIIDNTAYICMDFADGGDLNTEIEKTNNGNGLNEKVAKRYFSQIVLGVGYLHRIGIAHRDLKCENILLMNIKNGKKCQIADFGLSRLSYYVKNEIVGTLDYMSPQLIFNKNVTRKSPEFKKSDPFNDDCYAMGVILYKMLTNVLPFQDCTDLKDRIEHQLNSIWYEYPDKLRKSTKVNALLRKLLKPYEPRANLSVIVADEWLEGYTKKTTADPYKYCRT